MEELNRILPTHKAEEWNDLGLSNGFISDFIPYQKTKGNQYARPFFIGYKGPSKKQIIKTFKKLLK